MWLQGQIHKQRQVCDHFNISLFNTSLVQHIWQYLQGGFFVVFGVFFNQVNFGKMLKLKCLGKFNKCHNKRTKGSVGQKFSGFVPTEKLLISNTFGVIIIKSLIQPKTQSYVYIIIKLLTKIIGLIWTLRNDNVRSQF